MPIMPIVAVIIAPRDEGFGYFVLFLSSTFGISMRIGNFLWMNCNSWGGEGKGNGVAGWVGLGKGITRERGNEGTRES